MIGFVVEMEPLTPRCRNSPDSWGDIDDFLDVAPAWRFLKRNGLSNHLADCLAGTISPGLVNITMRA